MPIASEAVSTIRVAVSVAFAAVPIAYAAVSVRFVGKFCRGLPRAERP